MFLSDIEDVFDGKLNIARVFIDNFGAIRPLKYSLYDYFPNPDYVHTAAKRFILKISLNHLKEETPKLSWIHLLMVKAKNSASTARIIPNCCCPFVYSR